MAKPNADEMQQRLTDVWHHFEQSIIDDQLISGAKVFAQKFVWNEDLLSILVNVNVCRRPSICLPVCL